MERVWKWVTSPFIFRRRSPNPKQTTKAAHRSPFPSAVVALIPQTELAMGSLLGLTLLLAFVLYSVTASPVHSPKLGPRIGQFLSQGERDHSLPRRESIPTQSGSLEETTAIWILFNSKCADETPSRPLSDRAMVRRAKHGFVCLAPLLSSSTLYLTDILPYFLLL
jgi:hypothetical protein